MTSYNPRTRQSLLIKTIEEEKSLNFNPKLIEEHKRQLEEINQEIKEDDNIRKDYQKNKELKELTS